MERLFVPVILGTAREGRRTENAARFVHGIVSARPEVETALIDVRDFRMPATDDREETPMVKKYREIIARADALVIVTPEYNHGYPGELKMMLDMAYGEYKRKPVAVCGAGGGMGGARMMEQLRSVLIELRAIPVAEAVYFSKIGELFDETGSIRDAAYAPRVSKMLDELLWYADVMKSARAREHA